MKGFRSRPLPLIGLMASFPPYGVMRGMRGMRGMGTEGTLNTRWTHVEHTLNMRWTLIERAWDVRGTRLIRRTSFLARDERAHRSRSRGDRHEGWSAPFDEQRKDRARCRTHQGDAESRVLLAADRGLSRRGRFDRAPENPGRTEQPTSQPPSMAFVARKRGSGPIPR